MAITKALTPRFLLRDLLKGILRASFSAFKIGLVCAILGLLAVYLFRPGTSPDEALVFVLAPMAIFFAVVRMFVALISRINVHPSNPVQPDGRTRFIVWTLFFALLALVIGFPSMLTYRSLGIGWAADFAIRSSVIFAVTAILTAVCAGTRAVFVFEFAFRFLTTITAPKHTDAPIEQS